MVNIKEEYNFNKKIEYYEHLGRHPARAGKIAQKQGIAQGEPRTVFAEHYKNTAAAIKLMQQDLNNKSRRSR